MSGCSGGVAVPGLQPAVAVDLAATRCPEIDARTRAEFRKVTPPPAAELTRAKVDELRASEIRKNAAGQRVIAELDRCRGQAPVKKAEPKTS